MDNTIYGVPVVTIAIGGGVLLLVLVLLAKFGKAIAWVVLAMGLLAVAIAGSIALASQGAANYQSSKGITEAVKVVEHSNNSLMYVLGGTVCLGGLGFILILALIIGGLVLYYYLQQRNQVTGPQDMGQLIQLATITAVNQLMLTQEAAMDHLRGTGRRGFSYWSQGDNAPLPIPDERFLGAVFNEGQGVMTGEGWGDWPDETQDGGGELWQVE